MVREGEEEEAGRSWRGGSGSGSTHTHAKESQCNYDYRKYSVIKYPQGSYPPEVRSVGFQIIPILGCACVRV